MYQTVGLDVGMLVALRAVPLDDIGDGVGKAMLREIKLLSRLRHPHIVRLMEILRDENSNLASNYMNPSGRHCVVIFFTTLTRKLPGGYVLRMTWKV